MVRRLWIAVVALVALSTAALAVTDDSERPPQQLRAAGLPSGSVTDSTAGAATETTALLGPVVPAVTVPTVPRVTVPRVTVPKVTIPAVFNNDVFYVQPYGEPHTLREIHWSGTVARTINIDQDAECCGMTSSAPDGSRFALGSSTYSSDGTPRANVPHDMWADDNEHLCRINFQHTGQTIDDPMALDLYDLSGAVRRIANLPAHERGSGAFSTGACSVRLDRAIVFLNNPPNRRGVIVRLSDGAVSDGPAACPHPYSVSGNGRIIASEDGDGTATICDVATGARLGHTTVGKLNGDGSAILTVANDDCGWRHENVLLDWRTGEKLWSSNEPAWRMDCQHSYIAWRFHEAGDEVAVQASIVNAGRDPGDVLILKPHHPAKRVATNITYSQVF